MQSYFTILPTILFILLATAAPQRVAADDAETAKAFYTQGVVAYKAENYAEALDAFKESYNLSGKAALLFNIAMCEEKLGETEHAIAYYELYLEELPDADDAESVKNRVEKLKNPPVAPETVAPETATGETSPADSPADKPTAATQKKPATQSIPGDTTGQPSGPLEVYTPPDPTDHRQDIFQGILIGTGALLVGTGAITAIGAYKKHDSFSKICAPDCTDSEVEKVKRLSLAADLQMGIGIVALTSGIIWDIVHRRRKAARDASPYSRLRFSPLAEASFSGVALEGRF